MQLCVRSMRLLSDVSLRHGDRDLLLSIRAAELPQVRAVGNTQRPERSAIIPALRADDLPYLRHRLHSSVWPRVISLLDLHAPNDGIVAGTCAHARHVAR